jgi:hypothetical protein
LSEASDVTQIGAVVTTDYLLDFLTLYESLAENWTASPFRLHAFALDDETARRLTELGVDGMEVHRLPGNARDPRENAARRIDLIEHSGLERCIVSDADTVFLAETAQLWTALGEHDLAFSRGTTGEHPVQTALWAFRRNERSIALARNWHVAIADLIARGAAVEPADAPLCPDADIPDLALRRAGAGFFEERAGRIDALHLRGLGGLSHGSLVERIDVVVDRFPRIAAFVPYYVSLAERAAIRLGLAVPPTPAALARSRLLDAGMLASRSELPEFLNRRGLLGTGVEIGVKRGLFSEEILNGWHGRTLISVDPWLEAPVGEYRDIANVSQSQHEGFYEETVERLARFGERSVIWRTTSADAAARIKSRSLDFAYLDARHDYGSVREDLELWFDKLRPGGVFAGHDYLDAEFPWGAVGVKSAVDEFFGSRGLRVRETYLEARGRPGLPPSWLVELPPQREA